MESPGKVRDWLVRFGLILLAAAAVVGLFLTQDSTQPRQSRNRWSNLVDQRKLQTARDLAATVTSWDEQRYSRQALRLADHEVDQAFASAMRNAADQPPPQTPEARAATGRISSAEKLVSSDEDRIDRLKKELTSAGTVRRDALQQRLDLVQSELEIDQDDLNDARDALARAGGDVRSRVQRLFQRHQADEQQSDDALKSRTLKFEPDVPPANLLSQFSAWKALHAKLGALSQARDEAQAAYADLKQQRAQLQAAADAERAALPQPMAPSTPGAPAPVLQTPATAFSSVEKLAKVQKNLSDTDKRLQDCQDLADAYSNWLGVVQAGQLVALHGILRSALWIVIIVFAAYEIGRLIDRLFTNVTQDRRRLHTLRVVLRSFIQVAGLLIIVFVILGIPAQMATIIGLATAGLTVALKDFVVGFCGWFVLMGRNGIRVGDWVEVNGVVGEVAEVNLWRTILLETGNWTDTGHPTGRKVAFMNSFAIEGHFFNFSTAGQWLWDELQILVPPTQDPYSLIEEIQKVVTAETKDNTSTAEQEWKRATSHYRVRPVSAAPAIHLRPTSGGMEVHVRYITPAHERSATRARLYQELADLLHHKQPVDAQAATRPAQ